MDIADIQSILQQAFENAEIEVTGDGSHFQVIVISDVFEGLSRVKRQQAVYALLNAHILSGALHALTIKAHTPAEWAKLSRFRVG